MPTTQNWVTQRNRTPNHNICTWAQAQDNDQWRGIAAVARQSPTTNRTRDAMPALRGNQYVPSFTAPCRLWHTTYLLSGKYVVGASTCNLHLHDHNDRDGSAQLGLIPVARLLNRVVARALDL